MLAAIYIYTSIYINVMPPQETCDHGAQNVRGSGRHRLTKPGRSRLLAVEYVCKQHTTIFQGDAPTEKSRIEIGGRRPVK